jgi:hypothetical protein
MQMQEFTREEDATEREPFLARNLQPLALKDSLSSLQSQMEEMQARESWYKSKVEELEASFDRCKNNLMMGASAALGAAAAVAATQDETDSLRG